MAIPTYTTDLTTISTADSGTFGEPTATGWIAGAAPALDNENFIQGTGAQSKAFNATGVGGIGFLNGAAVTPVTDGAFLAWIYWASPNTLDSETNGGIRLLAGNSAGAFYGYKLAGNDSYQYGGWTNYAVNIDTAVVTPDYTAGAPTTTKQYFGMAVNNLNAITKGNPCLLDAIRYGRGESRFANGSLADGYATFDGFAATNDSNTNRWGLIQGLNGAYQVKGLVIFGYVSAVAFKDSNKALFIQNTKKVSTNYNTIEIRQATSTVYLTSITFTALGTVSRGRWVTTDDASVSLTSCVFTDMATFGFASKTTGTTCTFRRCDIITQNGSRLTNCTIDASRGTKAVLVNDISIITKTSFISSGTGYALEGFSTGGEYSLNGLTFANYAATNGTTGNEAIHVLATTGVVNLNVLGGGSSSFSIRTDGATVNIVAGSVTVSVTVKNTSNIAISGARVLLLANSGGALPYNATVTIVNSSTTATVTHTAHGMLTNDKVQIAGASLLANNGVFSITKITDNSYSYTMATSQGSSPTGTIKATYAALEGLTDTNGLISTTRVFGGNQPVYGRVRKSSGTPLYKTTDMNDTISSVNGLAINTMMILDE